MPLSLPKPFKFLLLILWLRKTNFQCVNCSSYTYKINVFIIIKPWMFFTCLLVWKLSIFNRQKQPPEVFYKKGVLENFAKFTGKHLSQSLFCKEVAALRRATLLKERLWHKCFSVNFAKLLRTTLFWIICCQPRKKKF